jgi:uncharacterized protein YndB with AHSA1/START domain
MTQTEATSPAPEKTGNDYEQTVIVHAGPDAVFDALTTLSGLTAWWSPVSGSGEAGGELSFIMNAAEPCVMRVDVAARPALVQWTCISCDFLPDWVGTRPTYTIIPLEDGTTEVRFRHIGLTPNLECIDMCTSGWNHFIPSLRDYVETGTGSPLGSPGDMARRERDRRAG